MAKTLIFRRATDADVPTITRIYNQGIEDRIATLETQLRTEEERLRWLHGHSDRYPVFVTEVTDASGSSTDSISRRATVGRESGPGSACDPAGARVVGWASLNQFNPRDAYRYTADFSLYVEREWRGRGVGRFLLEGLIAAAREIGFHKMVLSAFPWNGAGMALYRRAGFREVGIFKEMGQLDGRWVDTVIMEKLLD